MLRMSSLHALLLISGLISAVYSQPLSGQKNIRTRRETETDLCYGSVIDAGSSGTRVNVYSWACRDKVKIPQLNFQPIKSLNYKIPLSTFNSTIDGIFCYFEEIIPKIKEIIPAELHSSSPIMIGATAGLRLLPQHQQNLIMNETISVLSSSGFLFAGQEWGRVLTGKEEGAYLWISINYLMKAIKDNSKSTTDHVKTAATIDLGGASTQITFQVPNKDDSNYEVSLPQNNDYDLFSESYLGFGNDQARNIVVHLEESETGDILSGCFNEGYNFTDSKTKQLVIGTSQPEQCLEKIRKYFSKENCENNDPEKCSINDTFLPKVPTDSSVIAVSGIYFAVSSFNLPSPFHPSDLLQAAIKFCSLPYSTVGKQEKLTKYTSRKCFLGLYAASLLSEAYNLGSYEIIAQEEINGFEPTWTLGYLISNLAKLECDKQNTIPATSCPKVN